MGRHFGFKVVPNGLLVDEAGVVRWAKFGGFSIDDPDDLAAAERFLAGGDPGPSPAADAPYVLGSLARELVATKVRLGRLLDEAGRRDEAVAVWREALRLEPANFTIRKQIWAAEHPEKFFPTIDFAWQQERLRAEREQEITEAGVPMNAATVDAGPGAASRLDPIPFGRGMAVVRVFFGLILFANGLSKLDGFTRVDVGPYHANLINRPQARQILDFEVNQRDGRGTQVPLLKRVVNDVVLPNWGFFGWVVTVVELGAGALLILGLATRGAALVALGQQLFLALVYASSNRWLFEQPHEYVPLFILAAVPAGRVWGLDAWITRTRPALRRWPC